MKVVAVFDVAVVAGVKFAGNLLINL